MAVVAWEWVGGILLQRGSGCGGSRSGGINDDNNIYDGADYDGDDDNSVPEEDALIT